MALGGNPIFNGKNFRGATQAPPVPHGSGRTASRLRSEPLGQGPYGQVMDAQAGQVGAASRT